MSVGRVSLSMSMRDSLLSLQKTSKLQDQTQLRLSTGLKVNSAIDNPGAYYSAASLSNRANDLSALLDSMAQGVQTVKAATSSLETISKFLQQSSATAQSAIEDAIHSREVVFDKPAMGEIKEADADVTKDWLLANGANKVVTTEAELLDAIDNGAENDVIVIMGQINIELKSDLSNQLVLQRGQKLVGTEYFAAQSSKAGLRDEKGNRLSSLTFTNQTGIDISAIQTESGSEIAALDINYKTTVVNNSRGVIEHNMSGTATVKDVDIVVENTGSSENPAAYLSAIYAFRANAVVNVEGVVNIRNKGSATQGLFARSGTTTVDPDKATINVTGQASIAAEGKSYGVSSFNSRINVKGGAQLAVKSEYALVDGRGITAERNAKLILENSTDNLFSSFVDAPPQISLREGSIISARTSKVNATWTTDRDSEITMATTTLDPFTSNFTKTGASEDYFHPLIKDVVTIKEVYTQQFNDLLNQIDMVANDSSYKGVNLLREQELNVRFNEDSSSGVILQGVDATSQGLGMQAAAWRNTETIQVSLGEIAEAVNKVRRYSAEFGNVYSIIENRENFTDNLINILNEGADKLTLADMNEESANTLALQTRSQLAVNALSLAGQAGQGILKLF